ncbi:conserved hypothetical protein [Thiolapillus brandeum]|uniref:Uncharacterized protein n=1 Tax=Thiolapillus brandeum TaxID=1076588 RepID=A0A7U6JH58_9GAMM|nr:conserved hypothetical protein [Thiolapillus brandeum]
MSNRRQRLYMYYLTAVLMDLVVLNLFAEYWNSVVIDSFSISLLAALLLQVMLKVSIAIEHRVGAYVQDRHGNKARLFSAWAILFVSKLIILEALSWAFSGDVKFLGAYHGLLAFLVVVIAMLAAEALMRKIYHLLGDQTP